MRFKKHLFICTNERINSEKKSCGEACGLGLVKEFKRKLREAGLSDQVRAQRTGCLDACEHGPAMVVYPEGVFYGGLSVDKIDEIITSHIINDIPLQKLVIEFKQ